MSVIRGEGYGSVHTWIHDTTEPFSGGMGSRYFCSVCGTCFIHMYDLIPDIFEAMFISKVPADCGTKKGWVTFGTLIEHPGLVEFSEQTDDAGMPLWERIVLSGSTDAVTQTESS